MQICSQLSGQEKNKGFTLIEVLIALFFFSVCMLGLGALQLNSMKSVAKAGTITKATAFAHSQIELIKSLPMTDDKVKELADPAITQNGCFWTQIIVTDDCPLSKRMVDSGAGLVNTTVSKTIEIKVFGDSAGNKLLADSSFIMSYTALE